MSENVENLILEILRGLRADVTDLRGEVREGFHETRSRLSALERAVASQNLEAVDMHAR
jgi:hypothetical protein